VLKKCFRSSVRYLCSAILILLLRQISYSENPPSVNLLNSGKRASAAGNYELAERDLRQAIVEAATSDAVTVLALGELGSVLLTKGEMAEAETMFNRAIGMIRSNRTLNQRHLPILLGMLGDVYQKTGKLRESEKSLNEALQLGTKVLSDSPLHMADLYNDLCTPYQHWKQESG
jgi:tetratricopeptide (TPR) repeat protein